MERYAPLEVVGSGAMGVVLRCRDRELERTVAVKLSRQHDSPELMARMHREAAALAALHHPNLVPVYDHGTGEGRAWMVMEFVAGRPLGVPEREEDPLEVMLAVADALEATHAAGLVHRDLKPSNVMVGEDGVPRLVDFGLARIVDPDRTRLTATGHVVGTLAYLAPEVVESGEVGPGADWYAWGLTLLAALEGRLSTTPGLAPVELRLQPETEDRGLRPLLEACLAGDPSARPRGRAELEELLGRGAPAKGPAERPSGPPAAAPAAAPEGPAVTPILLAFVGLFLLGLLGRALLHPPAPRPRALPLPEVPQEPQDPLEGTPLRWDPADPPGVVRHRASLQRALLGPGYGRGGGDLAVALTETLVEHYERFLDENDAPEPKLWDLQRACPRCPVAALSVFQATAYASWVGGRLPTCEEWERLAGPGPYPWGDAPPDSTRANYGHPIVPTERGHFGYLRPAGSFPAGSGPGGLQDLAGNVCELCRAEGSPDGWYFKGGDWNSSLPEALTVAHDQEPNQAFRSMLRMIRFRPEDAEGPLRGRGPKMAAALEYGEADIGFRVVWELPAGAAARHRRWAEAHVPGATWAGLPPPRATGRGDRPPPEESW